METMPRERWWRDRAITSSGRRRHRQCRVAGQNKHSAAPRRTVGEAGALRRAARSAGFISLLQAARLVRANDISVWARTRSWFRLSVRREDSLNSRELPLQIYSESDYRTKIRLRRRRRHFSRHINHRPPSHRPRSTYRAHHLSPVAPSGETNAARRFFFLAAGLLNTEIGRGAELPDAL